MPENEKICIFTDSSADIPYETVDKYGINILPVLLTYNEKTIREYFDVTPQEYWEVLKTEDKVPLTAQVPLNDFYEFYKKAASEGYNKVMGIIINGGGSGTFSAACTARDMFYEENGTGTEIVLLDSRCYSYVYGHVVVESAKLAKQGRGFREIVAAAQDMLGGACAVLGMYTLKYLKKSGRISGGAAFVGEALGLRPVAFVADGAVDVCGKVRGDRQVASAIIDMAKKQLGGQKCEKMDILYADVPPEEIDKLENFIKTEFGIENIDRVPIGASVTTNTGPNALAVRFERKQTEA